MDANKMEFKSNQSNTKIKFSKALPVMLKIAADLSMNLKKAGDFNFCAAKAKKYLNEKNQNYA